MGRRNVSNEPRGEANWAGEDLKPGHPPDKDEHPEIPDRPADEEPPRRGPDRPLPPQAGKPDHELPGGKG
jgi:hypothetical protein